MVTLRSGKTYTASVPVRRKKKAQEAVVVAKTTQSLNAKINKLILNKMETKRFSTQGTQNNLLSNTWSGENLCYWIQNGSTDAQRVGDDIYITKFEVALSIQKKAGVQNGMRIYAGIFKSKEEIRVGLLSFNIAAISLDPQLQASGAKTNPIIDYNRVSLLGYTTAISPQSTLTNNQTTTNMRLEIPINRKFAYLQTSSGYGKHGNYYLLIAYEDGGSGTDAATLNWTCVTHFKDA